MSPSSYIEKSQPIRKEMFFSLPLRSAARSRSAAVRLLLKLLIEIKQAMQERRIAEIIANSIQMPEQIRLARKVGGMEIANLGKDRNENPDHQVRLILMLISSAKIGIRFSEEFY